MRDLGLPDDTYGMNGDPLDYRGGYFILMFTGDLDNVRRYIAGANKIRPANDPRINRYYLSVRNGLAGVTVHTDNLHDAILHAKAFGQPDFQRVRDGAWLNVQ